jgi:subtilase family serine protease
MNQLKIHMALLHAFVFFFCVFISTAGAADFTVAPVVDTLDIAVYEVSGNYDADAPDGMDTQFPRQQIAREFYRSHPDDYDFLVIFSNFDFRMVGDDSIAFYQEIKNDVQGLGKRLFDNTSLYGSEGVLQGTIDMGNIRSLVSDPLEAGFSETMGILSHELLHRWAADVSFRAADGTVSSTLLGRDGKHWSFLLDTAGSLEYGNQWVDNGNGTFTSLAGRRYYSPLDLYLMGLLAPGKVPPMLLIRNPEVDPARMPEPGVTIPGTPQYISIDDIIATEGERVPGPADAQASFRVGSIFITRPGTYSEADLQDIRDIMHGWSLWFSGLTDGLGKVVIDNAPAENLPENPGPYIPPINPRTAPSEINDAIAWLLNNQKEDGSWQDSLLTTARDTSTVLSSLAGYAPAADAFAKGVSRLESIDAANLDYLAGKINLFNSSGRNNPELVAALLKKQNPDGGWGSNGKYKSNPADTALALRALSAPDMAPDSATGSAVNYLLSEQNDDSGWGIEQHSTVQTSIDVITAFIPFREQYQLDIPLQNALTWVYNKQNSDGGFGNSLSTIYTTAKTLITLKNIGITSHVTDQALSYIRDRQAQDGSWLSSPYQTAMAINAIWTATRDPDLSVSTTDIVSTPDKITVLPTEIQLAVTVHNSGMSDVTDVQIILYEGAVGDSGKIGEKSVSIAGQSSETVVFNTTINKTSPHHFYVQVDPDNLIHESSEQNNSALRIVYPVSTYDFSVSPENISITPPVGNIFEPLAISAGVKNIGTVDAFSVPLHLTADNGTGPITVAMQTIDLPAGQNVDASFSWVPEFSGSGVALSVILDPLHAFAELAEDNNTASVTIDINTSTQPELSFTSSDITISPAPALETGTASLHAKVFNRGFSPATDVQVDFYDGVSGENGNTHLGSVIIPVIAPGESGDAQLDWVNIPVSGERKITVIIDQHNLIDEINENNNIALTTLQVLALPDLTVSTSAISFSPEAPREGDQVTVSATVRNRGEQPGSDIPVTFHGDNDLIGTVMIPKLEANGQATVSVPFDTEGKIGITEIEVIVDPDSTIFEKDKANNRAVRKLGVQNVDLWLSNKYISPNGDGIQDSTEFGCRLNEAQSVTVALVDTKGEIVREYTGDGFVDTSYVTLTWDGLDNRGRVVDDGQYQIQVLAETGTPLSSLLVTVDNNRSPLTEAIGTEYLLQDNISCELPDIGEATWMSGSWMWDWFPDESGIIFQISDYYSRNAVNYPTGLYTMGPDGSDIYSLFPATWKDSDFFTYSYTFGPELALSPDSNKVAFLRNTYNTQLREWVAHELWTVDRRDGKLILLDSYKPNESDTWFAAWSAYDLRVGSWSPDGTKFIYFTYENSTRYEQGTLCIVHADGTDKVEVPTGPIPYFTEFKWSPDGNYFTYITYSRDNYYEHELGIVRAADGVRVAVAAVGDFQFETYAAWAQDSSGILYLTEGWYAGVDDADSVLLSMSLTGEIKLLWQSEDWIRIDNYGEPDEPPFSLIDQDTVVVSAYDFDAGTQKIYLVDRHGVVENNRQYTQQGDMFIPGTVYEEEGYYGHCEEYAVSPAADLLAYADCGDNSGSIRICTANGQCTDFENGEPPPGTAGWGAPYDLRWSEDGRRLAYITPLPFYTDGWVSSREGIVVLDVGSGEKKFVDPAPTDDPDADVYTGWRYFEDSLQWMGDNVSIIGSDTQGAFVVDTNNGTLNYLPIAAKSYYPEEIRISPLGQYLAVNSSQDTGTECASSNNIWTLSSLLNLSAILQVSKDSAAVSLKGTAADLNFADWQLEYADRQTPDEWHVMSPASEVPVVNGLLSTWVPPYEGSFLIRLTVNDKAGNTVWDRKPVTWGKRFSVTNFYKTGELFSPNGDGIKDTVSLNYTVNEPVNLEFVIYNKAGSPVKTYIRDHVQPGKYSITWDGRNESGGIVPDGYYSIRIFDYEFFFQVDTTPPNAKLQFSPVSCGDEQNPVLRTNLSGLARDTNLKSWTVLYGEGSDPQEWYEFKSGEAALAKTVQSFVPGTSPPIRFLDNRTYRIVVDDFAGNQSVASTTFNEEIFVLYRWDGKRVDLKENTLLGQCESPDLLPIQFIEPGTHSLAIVETLKKSIRSVTVQYRTHMQWYDAEEITGPPEGIMAIDFDTSSLAPDEIAAVRVKIIDESGIEYFTNAVSFNPPVFKAVMGCIPEGSLAPPVISMKVSLAEDLETIKIQTTRTFSGADEWQDFAEHDVFDGFQYLFAAPSSESLPEGHGYPLRLVGVGKSGRIYISNELTPSSQKCRKEAPPPSPPSPICKTTMEISYSGENAPCNSVSSGTATIAVKYCPDDGPEVLPDKINYYLEENGSWKFLKQFEPALDGWGSVTLDYAGLQDGSHPVKVDLVYGESVIEGFRQETLVVDRTLPEAKITYPVSSASYCARTAEDMLGNIAWFVDIEGVVTDTAGMSEYSLLYGQGSNPVEWRSISHVSCSTGNCEYYGHLAEWNVTGLSPEEHTIQLKATDRHGNTSCSATQVNINRNISLTASVDTTIISPNGDNVKDEVSIEYQIDAYAVLDVTVTKQNTLVRKLVSSQEINNSSGAVSWDGLDDAGTTVPDGTYHIQVEARDSCNNRREEILSITVDNTPPTTMFSFPGTGESLDVITEVTGTVHDAHLTRYQLQVQDETTGAEPILLNEGNIAVNNGILGVWNTFGLEGNWALILTGEDLAGNTRTTTQPVTFGVRQQLIKRLDANPSFISPNNDGRRDNTTITYELTDTANITIFIEDSQDNTVLSASFPGTLPGSHQYLWTGLAAGSNAVADGIYTIKIEAESGTQPNDVQQEQVTLVVDTTPPAINVTTPQDSSHHAGPVIVQGTFGDTNLKQYSVYLSSEQDTYPVNTQVAGSEVVFSQNLDMAEGIYVLQVDTGDAADNVRSRTVSFTVDKTRPAILLESPVEGDMFGGPASVVSIQGVIKETNLQSYSVQYGLGKNPNQWINLATGTAQPPDNNLATWPAGPGLNIDDGEYAIRVTATDKAGGKGVHRWEYKSTIMALSLP